MDTFSGWVEAYPTSTEKAIKVAKLKEIICRFRLLHNIKSDNGPLFTSEISQKNEQALQIQWKLHAPWRPQFMRKTEKVNHKIKKTLEKMYFKCQETHLKWDQALHIALFWIRVAPRSRLKLNLCKIVYGRPFQICFKDTFLELEHWSKIKQHVQHLRQTLTILHNLLIAGPSIYLTIPYTHSGQENKTWAEWV